MSLSGGVGGYGCALGIIFVTIVVTTWTTPLPPAVPDDKPEAPPPEVILLPPIFSLVVLNQLDWLRCRQLCMAATVGEDTAEPESRLNFKSTVALAGVVALPLTTLTGNSIWHLIFSVVQRDLRYQTLCGSVPPTRGENPN